MRMSRTDWKELCSKLLDISTKPKAAKSFHVRDYIPVINKRLYQRYGSEFSSCLEKVVDNYAKRSFEGLLLMSNIVSCIRYKEMLFDLDKELVKETLTQDEAIFKQSELFRVYQFTILKPKIFAKGFGDIQKRYYEGKRRIRGELLRRALEKLTDEELDCINLSYLEKCERSKNWIIAGTQSKKSAILKQLGINESVNDLKPSFALSISVIKCLDTEPKTANSPASVKVHKIQFSKTRERFNTKMGSERKIVKDDASKNRFKKPVKKDLLIKKPIRIFNIEPMKIPNTFKESLKSPRRPKLTIQTKIVTSLKNQCNKMQRQLTKPSIITPNSHCLTARNFNKIDQRLNNDVQLYSDYNLAFKATESSRKISIFKTLNTLPSKRAKPVSMDNERFNLMQALENSNKKTKVSSPKPIKSSRRTLPSDIVKLKCHPISLKTVTKDTQPVATPKDIKFPAKHFETKALPKGPVYEKDKRLNDKKIFSKNPLVKK